MDTPRTEYKIDQNGAGSDLAGEMAAALAAASIAFRPIDPAYADTLLSTAKQLFHFADQYRGLYSDSVTQVSGLQYLDCGHFLVFAICLSAYQVD